MHWLKVKNAASYAGVSERTFRPWLNKGLVHSRLPTGTILIHQDNIDAFLKRFEVSRDRVKKLVDDVLQDFT